MKIWDKDPLVSRNIEQKRTNLAIKYLTRVETWIKAHKEDHKMAFYFNTMQKVLIGKAPRLSIEMLDGLETNAKKFLESSRPPYRVLCSVDLTSDEPSEPEQNLDEKVAQVYILDSPPRSPSPEQTPFYDSPTTSPFNDSSSSLIVPEPSITTSPSVTISPPSSELPELPSAESAVESYLDSPLSDISTTTPVLRQRRKSILLSGAVAKDQPSIAEYKIKHKVLKPPCIYAKPKEQDGNNRVVISVPYKTTLRQAAPRMDPKEEALKLAGVKDRIYMNNYLHIDAARKEEMIKKQKTNETKRKIEEMAAAKKARQNSVAMKKQDKEISKVSQQQQDRVKEKIDQQQQQQDCVKEKTPGKSTIQSKSKIRSKSQSDDGKKRKNRRIVYSDSSEDESYVAPAHVYENIELELADIFVETEPTAAQNEQEVEQPEPKKRRKSEAVKDSTEQPKILKRPTTKVCADLSTSSFEEPSIDESTKISFSERRMTRSKSMMIEPRRVELSDDGDGIEVLNEPMKPVKLKPKVKKKPKVYQKTQFARKRGRPPNFKNNIVSQANTDALRLPSDIIFSPQRNAALKSSSPDAEALDEDLLIEVQGTLKIIKRKTELRPRRERRPEVDEAPVPPAEVKHEPPDLESD